MTDQPWQQSASPEEQRTIDEKIAARMGITVEQLHELDRQVAADVRARDAVPADERVTDSNPKFTKGFGPDTSENTIRPGEIREYYRKSDADDGGGAGTDRT
ncbi:hypothetical protein C8258_30385 [Nocardia sp. MDA0666]|uniref:hypothetical protein n=1 Tax=Nocardia sp. MDA0666 TaxID=2135448 RepID=UPI000D115B99|nr:hypothetical protein [Nocardia sp. MDA0666]PSR58975.1 hypothetical protein C8258_30385 [Nocardia sp. MDA0666]